MLQKAWHLPFPQARARDADHRRARACARLARVHRPVLDPRSFFLVRAAVAHRPRALVERGHEPARAAALTPLAQPRVWDGTTASRCRRCSPSPLALSATEGRLLRLVAEFLLQDIAGLLTGGPWVGRRGWSRLIPRGAAWATTRGDDAGPAIPHARHGARDLRHRRPSGARGQRLHRRVRLRDRALAGSAPTRAPLRQAPEGHHRGGEQRRSSSCSASLLTLEGLFGDAGWAAVGDRGVHAAPWRVPWLMCSLGLARFVTDNTTEAFFHRRLLVGPNPFTGER